jgi:hypothetical protein
MFELFTPKSPDEEKFVNKHVTTENPDRNEVNGKANGDDVFKATNIKPVDRKKTRYGYDDSNDKKVYEEDMFDEGIIDKLFAKPKKEMRTYKYSYGDTAKYPEGEKPFQKATKPKAKNDPVPRDEHGDTLYQRVQKSRGMNEAVEPDNNAGKPLINRKPSDNNAGKPLINRKPDNKLPRNKNVMSSSFTKEDIINRTIEKYMPEVADIKPLTMEQRLAKKLDGLSESHIALLFSLFTNLNEDNQFKMIDTCEDFEGINQLIDFAIENSRGE